MHKKIIFSITYDGKLPQYYKTLKALYEEHGKNLGVVMGTLTNAFHSKDGYWISKNNIIVKRLYVTQKIQESDGSLVDYNTVN